MSSALLKKVCPRCKESSVRTYWANVKALARIAGHENVPTSAGWLNEKLLTRVRAMPLNRFKRFAAAGVKAAQMYNKTRPKWLEAMSESTNKYAQIRESGKRTKREAMNWPEGGYQALTKLAKELHSEIQYLEKKKTWTSSDLYHYQKYVVVLFYSKHALRGDLADVRYKKPYGPNWIHKVGKGYKLHIGEHKTSRSHGAIKITIGGEVAAAFDIFLKHVRARTKHGYLLTTLRTGNRLQRADMLRLIRNTTKERLGKNIGVQLIRVLKVTGSQKEIDAAAALQKEMGHGAAMQKKYISR